MPEHLDGLLVVDKPEDISSAKVVSRVKSLLNVRKVGHTGTLDPFATGVLICCLNRATRLARFFLEGDKRYQATIEFGVETDTQDVTGKVVSTAHHLPENAFSLDELQAVLARFTGNIMQNPPVYSALKHKGVPLYKLARAGKAVEKPARKVTVHSIRLLDIRPPEVHIDVTCSSGTYIRTLAADIGRAMGFGGYLKALRRTESSGFSVERALALTEVRKLVIAGDISAHVIDMADALEKMPAVVADDQLAEYIRNGRPLSSMPDHPDHDGYIKIVDRSNQLLAVLEYNDQSKTYTYCCVLNK